jgi:hypothetical protein
LLYLLFVESVHVILSLQQQQQQQQQQLRPQQQQQQKQQLAHQNLADLINLVIFEENATIKYLAIAIISVIMSQNAVEDVDLRPI